MKKFREFLEESTEGSSDDHFKKASEHLATAHSHKEGSHEHHDAMSNYHTSTAHGYAALKKEVGSRHAARNNVEREAFEGAVPHHRSEAKLHRSEANAAKKAEAKKK